MYLKKVNVFIRNPPYCWKGASVHVVYCVYCTKKAVCLVDKNLHPEEKVHCSVWRRESKVFCTVHLEAEVHCFSGIVRFIPKGELYGPVWDLWMFCWMFRMANEMSCALGRCCLWTKQLADFWFLWAMERCI